MIYLKPNKSLIIILSLIWGVFSFGQDVTFSPRLQNPNGVDTYINIKGDYTFLSNSVMNRISESGDGSDVNTPYNGSASNNGSHVEYIDIDSDASTFSSSSSTLTLPDCSRIYYAGLYWAGNYDQERRSTNWWNYNWNFPTDNNHYDVTSIKLKVPGGTYVDLQADNNPDLVGEEDDIIIDGYNNTSNNPYVCYKNVTNQLQALANPAGEYTVANVRGTRGATNHGVAGWTLVIIYENPTLPGQYISVFDGYEGVTTQSGNSIADINVAGFNTIPVGPVNARIGVSAMEGESSLSGDTFGIISNSSASFTDISNSGNPSNNFFNSSITEDGVNVSSRNINSTNSMGYDSDVFDLNNPSNSIIDNGDTDATLRLGTSGDWFSAFLVTFSVEIIEPTIVVEKKVEDIGGTDITGLGVNLGQPLDYVLSFQNIGNDDGTNYTLRDVLPINVSFDEINLVLPPGVTYVYNPIPHEIIFTIPDSLIEEGDPRSQIRLRVRVAENCFDFVNACTNTIQNVAYSTYEGVINDNQITDDPSVSDFNDCGFVTPGATNFLLDDLENCDFSRTVQLCGDDVILDAGDNFDDYVWYKDENGDHLIDAGDTVLNDGNPDGDLSTLIVDQVGIYIVDKIIVAPCIGFQEIITVENFGATQTNPIVGLINDITNTVEGEVVTCPNDGELFPKIFLCGLNDTELISINIPDALSIEWEQLDEASCTAAVDDCANKNGSCTWNTVGAGSDFVATNDGKYRITINYLNGCSTKFYFDIFKNPLDPQYISSDIICTTPGNITITNMPANYDFQLLNAIDGSILVPYSNLNGPSFDITTNGAYSVEMKQQGVVDGCIFRIEDIGILSRDFQVDVVTKDTDCTGLGEIAISVLNVEAQYYYEISLGGSVVDTFGPSNDNNYTFQNLNDGIYDIVVTTDDGCNYTEQVIINDVTDLAVTATTTKAIDCADGIIQVVGTGGVPNPEYLYAIWSYNGADLYATIGDIPGSEYQVLSDFNFDSSQAGDYEFVVVDSNNCSAISNIATIAVAPSVEYTTSLVNEACFGASDGSYAINVTNSNGYSVSYELTYPDTSTVTNASGSFPNLGQGGYSLTLTQTLGAISCDFIETFTIGGPVDGVTGDAVLTQDYTCLQTGTIEAQNVIGGTAPYEYSIDGVNFFSGVNSETFSSLTNGSYNITIRDGNNCTFVTNTIIIDPLNEPTGLNFTASQPTCPALTSDVVVTAVGGNTPFVFEIISPSAIAATTISGNTANFNGLAPNTYLFRVTDNKGCFYEDTFSISNITPIDVTGQLIGNITCFTDTDGEALFTVSGFATSYDYTVTGPANFNGTTETATTIPLTGLDDGIYTIIVTDNNTNCTDTTTVTISAPSAALTLSVSKTDPTCLADGSVTLTATGGWGSNTFSLINPDTTPFGTNTTGSFSGLTDTSGPYTVSVTDANNCIVTTTFTLNAAVAPTLAIVANDMCYDSGVGLTLTANVTAGGDGNYEYSINGGAFNAANVFSGLSSGTYIIDVRDGNDCTDSASITINPELTVSATANNIAACGTTTDVTITAAGGDGSNYVYALVNNGATPNSGDFSTTNPITVTGTGDYDVYVRDNNGNSGFCESQYDITIAQDLPVAISVSNTPILCSGESSATINIIASGGAGTYEYSIDDGVTYQSSNSFVNHGAGSYNLRVRDLNNCEVSQIYVVTEPFTLSASALVAELIECNPSGAEIKIINARGGTAPYQYSFDGGATYIASDTSYLFPGLHSLYIKDANNCTLEMEVTVLPPYTPPGVVTAIDYACDGEGTITVTPDDPSYDYTYEIDAVLNTPATSNVFTNIPPGNHVVTVNYVITTVIPPSTLLFEDFGFGTNTSITQIDPAYCYEPQDGSASLCGFGTDTHLQDGEYVVTQGLINNYGSWLNPNDHTGNTNGRFLAINVGGVAGLGGIVYAKRNVEVLPSQDITISLSAFNLLRFGTSGADPSIEIQLVDGGGAVIASTLTGNIPKNTGVNDWHDYSVTLNPGANTSLDIVIRTNSTITNGNDIAIDDLLATQPPAKCPASVFVDVYVEPGKELSTNVTATPSVSCNGGSDGSITFEVENFDAINGFEYSINGGGFSAPQTSSPITVSGLSAGNIAIVVRDVLDNSCSISFSETITEPTPVVASATVTSVLTCINDATITASATGGTPTYEYQLEDDLGNIIDVYQTSAVFNNVVAGDYIVRARDINLCTDPIDAVITITPPTPIVFSSTPTACYSGNSDGSILVNVTAGNGGYQFSLNGGPWITPSPTTATTYSFDNLSDGTYDIDVKDQYGCPIAPITQTVTINSALNLSASAPNITSCATTTDVTITASGGDGIFVYAIVSDGVTPVPGDFGIANPITINGAGNYDVYVRDNNGVISFCETSYDLTITQDAPIVITPSLTQNTCFGGITGQISLAVTGGNAPYDYSIDNGTTYQTTTDFFTLSAGTYNIRVRDNNNCEETTSVAITEPTQIVAEATQTQNYTCLLEGEITVGNVTPTFGGSGNYQYSLNGGTWTASTTGGAIFSNLLDGTYTVDVRDANDTSCTITLPNIVINPLPIEPVLSTSITYNCDGSGNITVLPSDVTYTYSIDGNAAQASNVFNNIAIGSHVITVDYGSDCTVDTTVLVESGNAFDASITSVSNVSCNGIADGSITFQLDNFSVGGFEYSLDNFGTILGSNTTSPETISGLTAGSYTISIRDVSNPTGCVLVFNQTITEPVVLIATAVITNPLTCSNLATITASATGGSPAYSYQLEDDSLNIIVAYQASTVFNNVAAGDYIVRVRDINLCADPIDLVITIAPPTPIVFSSTPTACYSGNSDGSILVNVTAGNGGYQFSLNGGPWITPSPSTATTYTFNNLVAGNYTIDVKDEYGCPAPPTAPFTQNVTINDKLLATIATTDLSSCTDGSITVSASGGDSSYEYAYVLTTLDPTGLFVPSNTFAVTTGNHGTYDVYVRDNSATSPFCEYVETVTINPAVPLAYTAIPTDPECFNGLGSIAINITSGTNPYEIEIIDLDNGGASDQTNSNVFATAHTYYNLLPGNYTINVSDSFGCLLVTTPVTINNPDELTADIIANPAPNCSADPNDHEFSFVNYPLTIGTIEFSDDGGTTWQSSNIFIGYLPGDTVNPSMRTVSGGVAICQTDFPPEIIPYPLDDLNINVVPIVVNCNELQVTVQGTLGLAPYQYAYTDDPDNFNPLDPSVWTLATAGNHLWSGLIPGRTYVFYVRDDTLCTRQSSINVNDIILNPPIDITSTFEPSCFGANNGEIVFTLNPITPSTHMRWELFEVGNATPVAVSGLGPTIASNITYNSTITIGSLAQEEYYIEVTQVNGIIDACIGGSENILIEELDAITATITSPTNITCNNPGLILIDNITGGGGTYNYTVTAAGFTTITGTTDNPIEINPGSPAGLYTVLVEDQYGCSYTDTVTVNLDLRPEISLEIVSNCPGEGEFQLIVTLDVAGIGTYALSLNGGPSENITFDGSNEYLITGLSSGAGQTVSITDLNGCADTDPFTIYPPLEFTATQTKLIDCVALNNNAEITINVTSGSGNYEYEIVGPINQARVAFPSNPFVWDLASNAGAYSVVVYDIGTPVPYCQKTIVVDAPAAITPIFTHVLTDITCNAANDGTITLFETDNGINPLTYTISPIAGNFNAATNTYEDLPPNTYTITARGTNNCTFDISGIVIREPFAIANVNATVVEFGCASGNNSDNATISIDPAAITGGNGVYAPATGGTYVVYEFINDNGTVITGDDIIVQSGSNTSYTETNIIGGSYTINVYDNAGCLGTTTATILPFDELLTATAAITNPITCNPGTDGAITITATTTIGNLAKLQYSIDNGTTYQASNIFAGLGVGTHNFLIRHIDTGCIITASETIIEPNTFTIDVVKLQDVICFGFETGEITLELVDPTYVGAFNWTIYDSNGTVATGDDILYKNDNLVPTGPTGPITLIAGDYIVYVSQAGLPTCTNSVFFSIAGPSAAITANTNVTEVTCALGDGVIEIIDVLGGWGSYSYFVGTAAPTFPGSYQASPLFDTLPGSIAGIIYQVWVADINGCEFRLPNETLFNPTAINATLQVNQANCTNLQGEIEVVSVTGGQGSNYTYQLIKDGSLSGSPQTSAIFSSLGAGSYTVLITDQWTCSFTTAAQLLYEEISPLTTVIKPIDCTATPGGAITISQTGGSGGYSYEVTFPDLTTTVTNTTGIFTGLTQVGNYTFEVTDQNNNCIKTIVQELVAAPTPIFTHTLTDITCNAANDGTITLFETDNGINPLTYTISPIAGNFNAATNTYEDLPPNTYTITARGTNNCTFDISGIVIREPFAIANVNATVVEFGCASGNNSDNATISIDPAAITGGNGVYAPATGGTYVVYEFINDNGTVITGDDIIVQSGSNTSYTETNIIGGSYTINVYDNAGCVGTTTATILPFDELLTATAAITNPISCNPGTDGEITITATTTISDLTKLQYSIDNGTTYQASNVFAGLDVGTHNFLIRHIDTGCIITASETIIEPNTFTIDVVKLQDVICFGTETGEITIELVDPTYVGAFNWIIYNTNGTLTNTADDTLEKNNTFATTGPTGPITLNAGSYIVEVFQNGFPLCSNTTTFTINAPSAAITANTNVTEVTCALSDGVIEIIDVLGGWGGYTYFVDLASNPAPTFPGSYQASPLFDPLPGSIAGIVYQVWVADINGCEFRLPNETLFNPTAINATLQINQENCTNLQGEIEVVSVTGGQGSNYTYQLIKDGSLSGSPQTSAIFSSLGAGSYTVLITDQWTCSFTTAAQLLYEEMNLTSTVIKPLDCTVSPGGEITITVNGGSTNLQYEATSPTAVIITNTTGVFTNLLQAGIYTFEVTDLDTTNPVCLKTITQELVPPSPVTFDPETVVNVSCFGLNDGSITANLAPSAAGVNDNPVYTYNLYDAFGALLAGPQVGNPIFSNLVAGDYTLEAISSRGCSNTQAVQVLEPSQLSVSAVATAFDCNPNNTVNTSIITVSIDDELANPGTPSGTGPYLYSIDNINFQTGNTFNIIDNGSVQNITVYVADANGCPATFVVPSIQPINVFTATVSQNLAISCNNPEEVLITVTDDGNINVYTYELLPVGNPNGALTGTPTAVTTTFDLAAPGTYTFRITDTTTGCFVDTAPYEILPYDLISVVATATTPVTCFSGTDDGAIEIAVSGYTGAYSYEVFNNNTGLTTGVVGTSNTTTTNPTIITGLSGGSFYVTITETAIPLCNEDSNSVTVISPDMPLIAPISMVAPVTCTNNLGEILVNPSGGYAPYDIVLNNTTTTQVYSVTDVNNNLFTTLSAGSYTVTVTDAGGCVFTDSIVLDMPTFITAGINSNLTQLVCFGDTNATINAELVSGGQGIYQYQLNIYDITGSVIEFTGGGQTSPVFNNLGAGTYSITVSDGWSCGSETPLVTINPATEVSASLAQTSMITCTTNAQMVLTTTGGSGPYEFSADGISFTAMNGGNTHLFTNVVPNTYQYFVRDSFACEAMISNQISVEPIEPISIIMDTNAAIINCTGENSAILITLVSGGLGNYSYELYGDAALTNLIVAAQPSGIFTNLFAGVYYVNVTSSDCSAVSEEVIIEDPDPLQVDFEDYTDVTCAGQNDGTITINVSGGTGEVLYAITPNLNQFDTINSFTDLSPGNYDVVAQDEKGCFVLFEFIITEPDPVVATFTALGEVCAGSEDGSIELTITGGTAPYRTAFNSNNDADFEQDRLNFNNIAAGTFAVFVRDAQDCETVVIVEIEPGVNINATVRPIYTCDANQPTAALELLLEDETVASDIMYSLDSTDVSTLKLDYNFGNILPGNHVLTIAHSNGCINTIAFTVEAYEPLALSLEQNNLNEITAVTTGGRENYTFIFDGVNNGNDPIYYITRTDTYTVTVIDENGCEVSREMFVEFIDIKIPNFFTPNSDLKNDFWKPKNIEQFPKIITIIYDRYGREVYQMNQNDPGWDGMYNKTNLPTGDYWYTIKLNGETDDREFVGHFTLYR